MVAAISKLLTWAAKNERHLGAVAFVLGFGIDLFTFTILSVAYANLAFAGYLVLASVSVALGSMLPRSREYVGTLERTVSIVAPLIAQYAIGSLLSGFMIFYTKSAELSASWPFLLFLAAVFVGNEFFRTYYKHLAFQLALLYFALYAYVIFAIPLFLNKLGPFVFLLSTAASVVIGGLYIYILSRINPLELRSSLRYALPGVASVLLLVNVAYFTGALPPIPLTMTESGIYHSLERAEGRYVVLAEPARSWYEFLSPRTVHIASGASLFAYAAVSAPVMFSASEVHRWERYDEVQSEWRTESRVTFAISGGRPGGFRGYSEFTPSVAGTWRVSVETPDGQVIGRIPFTLRIGEALPELHEETH